MSKKIIAALIAATLVFTCVFVACNKDETEEEDTRVYGDVTEYPFVTDENGDRVYTDDGEFVVYVTDEDGKTVTNSAGEPETVAQQFAPILEDNVAEHYGYTIELPDGWEPDPQKSGRFINEDALQQVTITVLEKTYDEYYESNKNAYSELLKVEAEGITSTWEEDVKLGEGCENVVRFTMKTDSGMNVMYFFINNDNLYKILFETANPDTAVEDSEAICAAVSYKPYQYFELDVTEAPTTELVIPDSVVTDDSSAQSTTVAQ